MNSSTKHWLTKIRVVFNAFSEESFSVYQKRCLTPLLNSKSITPSKKEVFKALEKVSFENVKVVILGQDPYYQVEEGNSYATGLAFALNPKILKNTALRQLRGGKSLREILRSVSSELNLKLPEKPDTTLEAWAKQGVLLLNTALTTKPSKPGAHAQYWKKFTTALILALNAREDSIIYVLTCNAAKSFRPLIAPHHKVFFNYRHPSRCWRISSRPNCKKEKVKFFALTQNIKINWGDVLAPSFN